MVLCTVASWQLKTDGFNRAGVLGRYRYYMKHIHTYTHYLTIKFIDIHYIYIKHIKANQTKTYCLIARDFPTDNSLSVLTSGVK